MNSKKSNKRQLGNGLENTAATIKSPKLDQSKDQSPAKKAKKLKKKKTEVTDLAPKTNADGKATTEAGEVPKLSQMQNKRKKSKERKLAAIARVKEAGGVPKPLWPSKDKKKENKAAGSTATKIIDPAALEKKLQKIREIRLRKKEIRKQKRKEVGQYKVDKTNIDPNSAEWLRKQIEEIKSRSELTKTAKRRLAVLKKKLAVAEGTVVASVPTKEKFVQSTLSKAEKRRFRREKGEGSKDPEETGTNGEKPVDIQLYEKKLVKKAKKKQEVEDKVQGEILKKPGLKEKRQEVVTKIEEEEDDDSDEEEAAPQHNGAGEDSEEQDSEESDENEEDEGQVNLSGDTVEDSDNDDDDDDGEDVEENDEPQAGKKKLKVVEKKAKQKAKENGGDDEDGELQMKQQPGDEKKKRFVLFVGNIPYE